MDAGNSAAGGHGAGLDGLVCAVEIVPRERLHVGAEDEIGVALPDFKLMLLGGAYGTADDLEDVRRSAANAILDTNGNTDDVHGAQVSSGASGNRSDEAAIGKAASSDFNGFEQAGESTTRADSFSQISVSEDDGLAVCKIRRDDGHGDAEILKAARFENLLDEVAQAVIAGEAQAGNTPAANVAKANGSAGGDDARKRGAAGIGRSENAADAGACDIRNRDVILLKDLENAKMRESARESAAESQAQTCTFGRSDWPAGLRGETGTCHARRMASIACRPNGSGVLKNRYERTYVPKGSKFLSESQTVPSY